VENNGMLIAING